MLAVADAKMRFIHINARFPESTHDAYMLAKSGLSDRVESFSESGRVPVARGFGIPIAYLVSDQLSAPKQQKRGRNSTTVMFAESTFIAFPAIDEPQLDYAGGRSRNSSPCFPLGVSHTHQLH
uniref:Uncharacterized protein n=1 Tax=Magallana gigas TaxID=29159 RepID=A0A8W8NVV7_MAGGI